MNSRLKFLSFIADAGLATNKDVQNLCYGDSVYGNTSARRLTLDLKKEGFLVFFESKTDGVGRSLKVFSINKDKKHEVMDVTGRDSVKVIDPNGSFHVKHQLCINSVLVSFLACCERNKNYECEFITDLEGTGRNKVFKAITEKEYLPYWGKVVFVPDAVICVTNIGQKRKALFFFEMDRETTTLKKIGGKDKNVQTKIKAYGSLWESKKFKKYDEVFDYSFPGFRLLWVALSQRRVDAVSKFCDQEGLGDSAWLSTIKEIESKGVFGKVWTVPGSKNQRSLVKEKA